MIGSLKYGSRHASLYDIWQRFVWARNWLSRFFLSNGKSYLIGSWNSGMISAYTMKYWGKGNMIFWWLQKLHKEIEFVLRDDKLDRAWKSLSFLCKMSKCKIFFDDAENVFKIKMTFMFKLVFKDCITHKETMDKVYQKIEF